jgi:hypothetical protein
MKAINFHYWLQESIELGLMKTLDKKRLSILKDHILLVEHKSDFIHWLDGFICDKNSIDEDGIMTINIKLQIEFTKVPQSLSEKNIEDFLSPLRGRSSVAIC